MTEQENLEPKETYTALSKCCKEKACYESLRTKLLEKTFEISENVVLTNREWLMYYRLENVLRYFPYQQPLHIDGLEAEAILGIKKTHDYSVGDIAFIFQRSKATIHEFLKKNSLIDSEQIENQEFSK
jgi:hypothetical protein